MSPLLPKSRSRKKMSTLTRGRSSRQVNHNGNSLHETVSKPTIPLINCMNDCQSSGGHGRTSDHSHLAVFFAQYTDFEYNPAKPATDEFYRLCDFNGWDKDEKQFAKKDFQDALTIQFNNIYGTNENDLTNWQTLCAQLGMDPVPESLKACRQVRKTLTPGLLTNQDILGRQKHACQPS